MISTNKKPTKPRTATIMFLASLGLMIIAGLVGANIYDLDIYDNFDDNDLNLTLWTNTTTNFPTDCDGTNGVLEANEHLEVQSLCTSGGSGSAVTSTITSDFNFTSAQLEITRATSTAVNGNAHSVGKIQIGGVTVIDFGTNVGGGFPGCAAGAPTVVYDDLATGNWTINRTDSKEVGVYKDGVFLRSITLPNLDVTNNFLSVTTIACIQTGSSMDADVEVDFNQISIDGRLLINKQNTPTDGSTGISLERIFNTSIYSSSVNKTNATIYVWNSTGQLINKTTVTVIGFLANESEHNVSQMAIGGHTWNVESCGTNISNTFCTFAPTNFSFTTGFFTGTPSFVSSVTETSNQAFNVTFNVSSGTPSANFYWNGTKHTGTMTNIAGNQWRASSIFDIPINLLGVRDTFWEIIASAINFNTTVQNQTSVLLNQSICGAPNTFPFINFTYKNETVAQEDTTAFVAASTWTYFVGSGTTNKTFTFSNAAEASSHAFCYTPPQETINTIISYSYDNSESQQRTYSPSVLSLTNTTTDQLLFLLPTSDGIFVTFQVLNAALQPIANAEVKLERAGFGVIAQESTGSSGTVNIFLNPNFQYTLTVTRSGFATFTATQSFPTNEFTITLGGQTIVSDDHTKGMVIDILPKSFGLLVNNTMTNFNMTLQSNFWTTTSYGFTITNSSGSQLASVSSTVVPGTVSVNLDTGNHSAFRLDYFWVINNSRSNSTVYYTINTPGDGSIKGFFTRLKAYLPTGIFGMDDFSLTIILFIIIFTISGVLSFKFGLTSAPSIMFVVFALVGMFDLGLGVLGNPFESSIVGLPTLFALLMFLGLLFREANR